MQTDGSLGQASGRGLCASRLALFFSVSISHLEGICRNAQQMWVT